MTDKLPMHVNYRHANYFISIHVLDATTSSLAVGYSHAIQFLV